MSLLAELAPNDYTNYLWMTEDNNRKLPTAGDSRDEHVGHPQRRPSMSVLGLGLVGSNKSRPNRTCSPVGMLVNAKYMPYVWGALS